MNISLGKRKVFSNKNGAKILCLPSVWCTQHLLTPGKYVECVIDEHGNLVVKPFKE